MSFTKEDRKSQSIFGKGIPKQADGIHGAQFADVIAAALHRDFGDTHAAVKKVVGLTNANERAVKNWFEAKNGPTGQHLVDLVRTSDEVLRVVLLMSGRQELVMAKLLIDSKKTLLKMLRLIQDLETSSRS